MKSDIAGQMTIVWGEQAEAGETFEKCAADQRQFKRCFTWQTKITYTEITEGGKKWWIGIIDDVTLRFAV